MDVVDTIKLIRCSWTWLFGLLVIWETSNTTCWSHMVWYHISCSQWSHNKGQLSVIHSRPLSPTCKDYLLKYSYWGMIVILLVLNRYLSVLVFHFYGRCLIVLLLLVSKISKFQRIVLYIRKDLRLFIKYNCSRRLSFLWTFMSKRSKVVL